MANDGDEHGPLSWALRPGRAPAHGGSARPPQDDDARRRPPARRHGRTVRHWARTNGVFNGSLLDGPINGDWFEAYVAQVLLPTLRAGDVGIMDNLSSNKRASVREMIEAKGARLRFLPPYSPDFNPIEMAFSKLKALLRKAAERTIDSLWTAIGRFVDVFTLQECANYFAAAGYDAE